MNLEQLLKENQEVLMRLATRGDEYYTPEQFLKSFEERLDKSSTQ